MLISFQQFCSTAYSYFIDVLLRMPWPCFGLHYLSCINIIVSKLKIDVFGHTSFSQGRITKEIIIYVIHESWYAPTAGQSMFSVETSHLSICFIRHITGHKGVCHPMDAVARCIFFNPLTLHMQLGMYAMHARLLERWKVLAYCFNFFLHYIITQEKILFHNEVLWS